MIDYLINAITACLSYKFLPFTLPCLISPECFFRFAIDQPSVLHTSAEVMYSHCSCRINCSSLRAILSISASVNIVSKCCGPT